MTRPQKQLEHDLLALSETGQCPAEATNGSADPGVLEREIVPYDPERGRVLDVVPGATRSVCPEVQV
ncbi:hypothetical protein [Pseudoclavibacter sp. AY1F1]|uniref:hypothetical protein n=1 Tax=Pseudoclavibacter sp. AY1F1 TaxID=2080583 RepID=UPI001CA5D2DA|nr:hypothetical protein [Pseudoclavibacter sp. AY1F1]